MNILKTIAKLKAAVSVLMDDDQNQISRAKLKYYKSCQINVDEEINKHYPPEGDISAYFTMDDA